MTPEDNGRFMRALNAARIKYPSLRIGQLIENARAYADTGVGDLFYEEDEALIRAIEVYVERS